MGLLKIHFDRSDDINQRVDANMSTCVGDSGAIADEIANNVRRTKFPDHLNVGAIRRESDKLASAFFDLLTA